MLILKIIIVILSIIIIVTWGIFCKNYIKQRKEYENAVYISNIIEKAYFKIQEKEDEENYKIIDESYFTDSETEKTSYVITTTLYKDGYYKEICQGENDTIGSYGYINYGVEDKENNQYYYTQFDLEETEKNISIGITFSLDSRENELSNYYEKDISEYEKYQVEIKEIDGKEYYCITDSQNTEIWIEKNNMMLYKMRYSSGEERTITWEVNNVKDEDVKINNIEEYTMDEYDKKLVEYYNISRFKY